MEYCLLCLNSENLMVGSIRVNSAQWQKQNVKHVIEKHLWPMDIAKSSDAVCITCWHELENFHRFYLLIQKTHATIGGTRTTGVVNECVRNKNSCPDLKECIDYIIETEIPSKPLFFTEYAMEKDIPIIKVEHYESSQDDKTLRKIRKRSSKTKNSVNGLQDSKTDPLNDSTTKSLRKHKKSKESASKCVLTNYLMNDEMFNEPNASANFYQYSGSAAGYEDCDDKSRSETSKKKRRNPDKKTREEHDKIIAEHIKISCYYCKMSLENFIALRKHFREEHNKRAFIICCKKKFFNRPVLVDHLNFHLDPNYFKCKQCEKVYSDRCTLDKHMRTHTEGGQGRNYNCPECGKSFVGVTQLENHKLTHAPDYEKEFSCSECGKLFTTLYNLNYHIKAIHRNKYAKICDICGKTIRNSFKLHMEKHDKKLATHIHCDVCGLRLVDKRSLKQHKASQHPIGGKKDFSCHICRKTSTSLRALRAHIRFAHETGYIHKCTLCDKAFKRSEALKEHMATHTGTPLYTCLWCPRTFRSNGNMYNHRKNAHADKWEELKRQKYIDIRSKRDGDENGYAD